MTDDTGMDLPQAYQDDVRRMIAEERARVDAELERIRSGMRVLLRIYREVMSGK